MKSNKEFLDGIYSKAEALENEGTKPVKNPRIYYRFAAIAAMIILIPTISFWNSHRAYEEISSPMVIRTINDPSSYFYDADVIVIGQTKEIAKSNYVKEENYIYTDITFEVEEVLKGDVEVNDIILRVNGGIVKAERVKAEMQSEFIEGKNSLVFLLKNEDGIYHLISSESKFEEVEKGLFKDKLGNDYKLEEIKQQLKMEE